MPRGSVELTNKREEEIVDACEKLYRTKGYHDITIKDISMETSMSRPSIYNYYRTKEEIFLALLTSEYERWTSDVKELTAGHAKMTPEELARAFAATLSPREFLLKISSMNLYEIEESSRIENLIAYKKAFRASLEAVEECLHKFLPDLSKQRIEEIRYAFFPFMYGIYPYVYPTEKQKEAMDKAGVPYSKTTIEEITSNFLKQILYEKGGS